MEIRLLEYFLAVCEELHFTKAAEKLRISQPTLSQQIRLLEDRLGTKLFKRVGKKVYIADSGKILLEHTLRIFNELEQAEIKIKELEGLKRGNLTIGCSGNHLLAKPVISFHKQYPDIKLSILEMPTEETRLRLLNNQLDIGIVFLPLQDDKLNVIPLFIEEFFLIVSVEHELSNKTFVKLEQLERIPMILMTKQYVVRQFIDNDCKDLGIVIEPILELSTFESLLHMASLNMGATILPKSYLARHNDDKIRKIPIAERRLQKTVAAVYGKDIFLDTTMKAFINHLTKIFIKGDL